MAYSNCFPISSKEILNERNIAFQFTEDIATDSDICAVHSYDEDGNLISSEYRIGNDVVAYVNSRVGKLYQPDLVRNRLTAFDLVRALVEYRYSYGFVHYFVSTPDKLEVWEGMRK